MIFFGKKIENIYESCYIKKRQKNEQSHCPHLLIWQIIRLLFRYEILTGLKAILPLWNENRLDLVKEFINLGYKAIVVCVNGTFLPQSFCGREFDLSFVSDLPAGVDACGENGEFHTFVYDGPCFKKPIDIKRVEIKTYVAPVEHGGKTFYFQILDLNM